MVLGVVSVVLLLLLLSTVISRSQLAGENREMQRIVSSLNYRLADLESRQLQSVPPGLLRIEYDRLVPLDNPYVKAIQLSSPPYSGGAIRFQLLVENQQGFVGARIEVFDNDGSYISEVALDSGAVDTVDVGSSRSISGAIYDVATRPSFFRVSVQ